MRLSFFYIALLASVSADAADFSLATRQSSGEWQFAADYVQLVEHLKPGDSVSFPNGRVFKLGEPLGQGDFTRVFSIADDPDHALRIPRDTRQKALQMAEEFSKASHQLNAMGVRMVKISEESGTAYSVVEKIPKMVTFQNFFEDYPRLSIQERKAAIAAMDRFAQNTSKFGEIADLHPQNLAYDFAKKEWVIIDAESEYHLIGERPDRFERTLFYGLDLDPSASPKAYQIYRKWVGRWDKLIRAERDRLWASGGLRPATESQGLREILSVLKPRFAAGEVPNESETRKLRKLVKDLDISKLRDPAEVFELERQFIQLLKSSPRLDLAYPVIADIGLKKILSTWGDQSQGLSEWTRREPLVSGGKSLSATPGQTAAKLEIKTVGHSTASYDAYLSLISSPDRKPNAFLSTKGAVHEETGRPLGFYVAKGAAGAYPKVYNVEFSVDPKAVDGLDFTLLYDPNENSNAPKWLLFHNRDVLTVKPATHFSTTQTPLEFLTSLKMDPSVGQGALRKFKFFEQMKKKLRSTSSEDRQKIQALLKACFDQESLQCIDRLNFGLRIFEDDPQADRIFTREAQTKMAGRSSFQDSLARFLTRPQRIGNPEGWDLLEQMAVNGDRALETVLDSKVLSMNPRFDRLIQTLLKVSKPEKDALALRFLKSAELPPKEPLVSYLKTMASRAQNSDGLESFASILNERAWAIHPDGAEMIASLLSHNKDCEALQGALLSPPWVENPKWKALLLIKAKDGRKFGWEDLNRDWIRKRSDFLEIARELRERSALDSYALNQLFGGSLSNGCEANYSRLLQRSP